jgi:hypothetical protein
MATGPSTASLPDAVHHFHSSLSLAQARVPAPARMMRVIERQPLAIRGEISERVHPPP